MVLQVHLVTAVQVLVGTVDSVVQVHLDSADSAASVAPLAVHQATLDTLVLLVQQGHQVTQVFRDNQVL